MFADPQKLIDALNNATMEVRSDYHLTLGGLHDALMGADDTLLVKFPDGSTPGIFDSYRGSYTDISITVDDEPITVSDFLERTSIALGSTFTGYKGGDYPADPKKPLWKSEHGEASGTAIIDYVLEGDSFILITKQV